MRKENLSEVFLSSQASLAFVLMVKSEASEELKIETFSFGFALPGKFRCFSLR
jgi:hypothetical protein